MNDQKLQLSKKEQKILDLAKSGGNDASLLLQEQIDALEEQLSTLKTEITKDPPADVRIEKAAIRIAAKLAQVEDGKDGERGEKGDKGDPGTPGKDGRDGRDGRDGVDGVDGKDGTDGREGTPGKDGVDGKDGSPDTPDQIIEKINISSLFINTERVRGLVDAIRNMTANAVASVGITTTNFFKNGTFIGRAKNINLTGSAVGTVTITGDQANIALSGGAGGGQVNSVVAGTGISVDSTDPANPIVTNTGTSPTYVDSEVPSGSGTSFSTAHTPTSNSLRVYRGGARQQNTVDYTVSGANITLTTALASGEVLIVDYNY